MKRKTNLQESSNQNMAITEERLRQTFSERLRVGATAGVGGAQEIYQEVKAGGDFLGFARRYAFSKDYRVARSALWGLTKANKEELKQLQVIANELIDQAMTTGNSSVRRLTLNIIERLRVGERSSGMRLEIKEDDGEHQSPDLRTDFLDFCFEHMMDVKELPGIQSVCMKLAFRMCKFFAERSDGAERYPELMDELMRMLEAMETDYYKPAVRCVRNKILSGTAERRQNVRPTPTRT